MIGCAKAWYPISGFVKFSDEDEADRAAFNPIAKCAITSHDSRKRIGVNRGYPFWVPDRLEKQRPPYPPVARVLARGETVLIGKSPEEKAQTTAAHQPVFQKRPDVVALRCCSQKTVLIWNTSVYPRTGKRSLSSWPACNEEKDSGQQVVRERKEEESKIVFLSS